MQGWYNNESIDQTAHGVSVRLVLQTFSAGASLVSCLVCMCIMPSMQPVHELTCMQVCVLVLFLLNLDACMRSVLLAIQWFAVPGIAVCSPWSLPASLFGCKLRPLIVTSFGTGRTVVADM